MSFFNFKSKAQRSTVPQVPAAAPPSAKAQMEETKTLTDELPLDPGTGLPLAHDHAPARAHHLENVAAKAPQTTVEAVAMGQVHRMTADERQAAFELARQQDPGPPARSGTYAYFVFLAIIVCLCSGDNGFDGTVMSSVNSMTQYQRFFGADLVDKKTSLVFGMNTIGGVVSFIPGSILPDLIGRRWTMFIGNVCIIFGALLGGFAHNFGMFLGGRFLVGLGSGTASNAAKPYLAEITSPIDRGRWLGLCNSFYYVGQILATGLAIPFGRGEGNYAWRGPIILQCAPAVIVVACVMFLPESPRWLYANGHEEKATVILAKFHSKDADVDSPVIQLQIQEIREMISLDGADKRWWDFRQLLRTRASRYRFWLCCITSIWGQLAGNGLITYYLPVLLNQAGVTSPDRQRVLNLVNSVTSFTGALAGSALVDFVGRRFLMLSAQWSCMAGMAIVAGLLSNTAQNQTRANAGISFIFLFMVFFSFGWTPLQGLYPTEVLSFENRAKGLALQGWTSNAVSLINTFGLPPALLKIGWKTYIIFACWDVVGLITVWWFIVETKRLSLEDLDDVFESPRPRDRARELVKHAKKRAAEDRQVLGMAP